MRGFEAKLESVTPSTIEINPVYYFFKLVSCDLLPQVNSIKISFAHPLTQRVSVHLEIEKYIEKALSPFFDNFNLSEQVFENIKIIQN